MAMRLDRLDLNLLVALDVLLHERSVSLAADRLCLSQSAMSSALGRLRDYFGDDLLVLNGRNMLLTRRAESLIAPVKAVLTQIRTTIAVAPTFDPENCDRQIRIMASDYTTQIVLEPAICEMSVKAPNMRFEIQAMNEAPVEALEHNLIDLLIWLEHEVSPDHPSEILFDDDYVVVGCAKNPALQGSLSKETYMSLGHVTTRFGKAKAPAFEDWFFRRRKEQRKVEVVVPSFMALPGLVRGTQRIATMHRRLAAYLAADERYVIKELPFTIPRIREVVQWYIGNSNDAALRWVIEHLRHVALASPGNASTQSDASESIIPAVVPFPNRRN